VARRAIHATGYTIPIVLTQPDRPHGRGLRLAPSAVKAAAVERGLAVAQPPTLRGADATLPGIALDVLVVAAYGLILPPTVLAWPRHGCLNIHASRLPRWRGAAPIARAIEAGDAQTGVTIMQMDAGLDTGPVVEVETVPIEPRETAGSLHDKLARTGAARVLEVLARLDRDGALAATPQPAEGATYAPKIRREEAVIDWSLSAALLDRRIRAFDPAPGALAVLHGRIVKIEAAVPAPGAAGATPGEVTAVTGEGVIVACGEGALRLTRVKPAGSRSLAAADFARGQRLSVGARFASGASTAQG
jgi:methionyl-tRNA formyltransferase